jgi:hypothetical protein
MADTDVLATLVAKDQIRELALLYSRAIDRQDLRLLRTLYTRDGHDKHGDLFDGSADDFCILLAESMPERIRYSGHHVCNHLISVDGDRGEGEVYALAYHTVPGKEGGWEELLMAVRYLDQYRVEEGRWRFARRTCTYDMSITRPAPEPRGPVTHGDGDESYAVLTSRIFARGARA